MDSSPATHRKDRLQDLPDDVFVKILLLLSFVEKTGVRLVSKKWKTAVEYVFAAQKYVRISAEPGEPGDRPVWSADKVCKIESNKKYVCSDCDRSIDVGFAIDLPVRSTEMTQSVNRFVAGCRFILKYFRSLTIIDLPWCWIFQKLQSLLNDTSGSILERQVADACQELLTRFREELECFRCVVFAVFQISSFPSLMHMECGDISDNVRNIFEKTTPKLRILYCKSIQEENFQHLPQGFLSFETYVYDLTTCINTTALLDKMLASKGRESICCIRLSNSDLMSDPKHYFPNLQSFQLYHLNAYEDAKLLRLGNLLSYSAHFKRVWIGGSAVKCLIGIAKNLKNLRELVFERLTDPTICNSLMESLADLEKLERLEIIAICCSSESIVKCLRGKSRKTLKHIKIGYLFSPRTLPANLPMQHGPHFMPPQEVDAIMQEMQIMAQTESLVYGSTNSHPINPNDARERRITRPGEAETSQLLLQQLSM